MALTKDGNQSESVCASFELSGAGGYGMFEMVSVHVGQRLRLPQSSLTQLIMKSGPILEIVLSSM